MFVSNREIIIQALETLGGQGYSDDIHKATGINKEVLCRTLRRMYNAGEIKRTWTKRWNAPCHLDYTGSAPKMQFLWQIIKE